MTDLLTGREIPANIKGSDVGAPSINLSAQGSRKGGKVQ